MWIPLAAAVRDQMETNTEMEILGMMELFRIWTVMDSWVYRFIKILWIVHFKRILLIVQNLYLNSDF